VDCRFSGRGESALKYLSRYLYRGVISESNIISDSDGQVSFRYTDGETGEVRTNTLPGIHSADFAGSHPTRTQNPKGATAFPLFGLW